MGCVNRTLQEQFKTFMTEMEVLIFEAEDIEKVYNVGDVQTTLSGYADGDALTQASKLTKTEFINGITLIQNINKFFNNQAVTQTDYRNYIKNIVYGNDAAATVASVATEELGDRLKTLCENLDKQYKYCNEMLNLYSGNILSSTLQYYNNYDRVAGTDLTAYQFNMFITFIEQFKKMLNNEAVTTGNYAATVAMRIR